MIPTRAAYAFLGLIGGLILSFAAWAADPTPLSGKVFGSGTQTLVVILHGDVSSGGPANYHYKIANAVAQSNGRTTVVGLLRPGYSDGEGGKSKGSNTGRRDHYTKRNNDLVAKTIANLQNETGASRVVVMGHSGGAAQLGSIIGRYPELVDAAILVSCPCNIREWRAKNNRSDWSKSQSPHRFVKNLTPSTKVTAITGSRDDNTFPSLASDYVAAAKGQGISAQFVQVNGAGHGFGGALYQAALKAIKSEIR